MNRKQAQFINQKGMNQDLHISKYSPEFLFYGKNIRLDSINSDTLMCISNEKGNVPMEFEPAHPDDVLHGICLGYCVIDQYLVLFNTVDASVKPDSIYRIKESSDGKFQCKRLFNGDLGFSASHLIETLGVVDSENTINVYFFDGENPPRVINVSEASGVDYNLNPERLKF